MGRKYTKRHTAEFQRDAIALVDSTGRTVTEVARELGVSSESLRGGYKQAKPDRGEGRPGELTTTEQEELKRLRRLAAEQAKTIELLRKAEAITASHPGPLDVHGVGPDNSIGRSRFSQGVVAPRLARPPHPR